jgi:hypothetical protein
MAGMSGRKGRSKRVVEYERNKEVLEGKFAGSHSDKYEDGCLLGCRNV